MNLKKDITTFIGVVISLLSMIYITSCSKATPVDNNSLNISFSVDTMWFDTVFTAQGSSTRKFKIYNKENKRVKFNNISLAKGNESPYFMNINGVSGKQIKDVYIEANDSIYVFIAVNIDPTVENAPFVVGDEISINTDNGSKNLQVLAYAQNAIYIKDSVLTTQTWTKDKPYIIIDNALLSENNKLTIEAGTRVYVHRDSRLFVEGTLEINGTKADSVIFRGDRIDRLVYYGDYTSSVRGEWGGIYFSDKSHDNVINYAIFRDGGNSSYLGENYIMDATLQVNKDILNNGTPKLVITNSIITNSFGYGMLAFNASIKAENNLFINSGKECVALLLGGNYEFVGNTISNYDSRLNSATANYFSFLILNFYGTSATNMESAPLNATIRNCIIHGNATGNNGVEGSEIFINKDENVTANVKIEHSLYKSGEALPNWVISNNNISNQNPKFIETSKYNYHLEASSPAINTGFSYPNMLAKDLDQIPRNNPPSMGCYEYQP